MAVHLGGVVGVLSVAGMIGSDAILVDAGSGGRVAWLTASLPEIVPGDVKSASF